MPKNMAKKQYYLGISIPFSSLKPCKNPKMVTVHNHVRPQPWKEFIKSGTIGMHGFRVWRCHKHKGLVACKCGWAPQLGTHYRVKAWKVRMKRGRAAR
jgi:hypothetical protein